MRARPEGIARNGSPESGQPEPPICAKIGQHYARQATPEVWAEVDELRAEVDHLRHILLTVQPYISDRAGTGILGAVAAALRARGQP